MPIGVIFCSSSIIIGGILGTLFGKYIYKKFFDKTGDKRSILS